MGPTDTDIYYLNRYICGDLVIFADTDKAYIHIWQLTIQFTETNISISIYGTRNIKLQDSTVSG